MLNSWPNVCIKYTWIWTILSYNISRTECKKALYWEFSASFRTISEMTQLTTSYRTIYLFKHYFCKCKQINSISSLFNCTIYNKQCLEPSNYVILQRVCMQHSSQLPEILFQHYFPFVLHSCVYWFLYFTMVLKV